MSTLMEIEAAADALPPPEQRILWEYLTAKLEQPPSTDTAISLHERMKEFCGMVDSGVPDLATNKKYMDGFGRSKK